MPQLFEKELFGGCGVIFEKKIDKTHNFRGSVLNPAGASYSAHPDP